MSDLISRQAFLDFIESVPFLLEHQTLKAIVIDWIKQQPAAYNVDKVVEKLEEYSNADEAERHGTIPVIELDDAIDIVKRGGVE